MACSTAPREIIDPMLSSSNGIDRMSPWTNSPSGISAAARSMRTLLQSIPMAFQPFSTAQATHRPEPQPASSIGRWSGIHLRNRGARS